jgi:hypothetical protein
MLPLATVPADQRFKGMGSLADRQDARVPSFISEIGVVPPTRQYPLAAMATPTRLRRVILLGG